MSDTELIQEFNPIELQKISNEFQRLKTEHYLDHVGASLYAESQVKEICENLQKNLYCNPHTSAITKSTIDQVRYRILKHFNTDSDKYSVIFTSGTTASLKLIAESFVFNNGTFHYLLNNHTSVLGMRQVINTTNIQTITEEDLLKLPNEKRLIKESVSKNSLVTFSAQCNFNGHKFPLEVIDKIHNYGLSEDSNYYVCLDAASYVSTNFLDLEKYHPDFVCLSFYKIFGYPTGLGALIVSKRGKKALSKKYYGGGTVQIVLASEENYHVKKKTVQEQFEDGTTPFLSIVALFKSFEFLERLIPCKDESIMLRISRHVFNLAEYVYENLKNFKHFNGKSVIKFYHENQFTYEKQGGVVNFNVMRSDGSFVGFSEFCYLASSNKITLRAGCFCNSGACQVNLHIDDNELLSYFKRGRVCGGDQLDLADGKPTGSVRVSFGYMTTKENVEYFIKFVRDSYVETSASVVNSENGSNQLEVPNTVPKLKLICLYPVKSCGAMKVTGQWKLSEKGLKYDREWMIVNADGRSLTQKNEPKMCLIQPFVNEARNVLTLNYPSRNPIEIPIDNDLINIKSTELCNSKVCSDRVKGIDCGDEVAEWLSDALYIDGLRLIKQSTDERKMNNDQFAPQISLSNQAQFLLVSHQSVKWLLENIPNKEELDYENEKDIENVVDRFRGNLLIENLGAMVENGLKSLVIGGTEFKVEGPCMRCQMICIDQHSGEKTTEPLRTVGKLSKGKMSFGIYLTHTNLKDCKIISCGDEVKIH